MICAAGVLTLHAAFSSVSLKLKVPVCPLRWSHGACSNRKKTCGALPNRQEWRGLHFISRFLKVISRPQRARKLLTCVATEDEEVCYHLHAFFLIMFPRVISALWRDATISLTAWSRTTIPQETQKGEKAAIGSAGKAAPSWSVNLRCVKEVHAVLVRHGHQVLRHLTPGKNTQRQKEEESESHQGISELMQQNKSQQSSSSDTSGASNTFTIRPLTTGPLLPSDLH